MVRCSFNSKLYLKLQTALSKYDEAKNFTFFKEYLLQNIHDYENEIFFVDESGLLKYLHKIHSNKISFFNGMILISQIVEELLELEKKIDAESRKVISAPLIHSKKASIDIPDFSLGPRQLGPSPKLSPLLNSGAVKKYKDIFKFWCKVCDECLSDERFLSDESFSLSTLMLYFDTTTSNSINFEKKLEMFRNVSPKQLLQKIITRKYYEPDSKKKEIIDTIFSELSFIA